MEITHNIFEAEIRGSKFLISEFIFDRPASRYGDEYYAVYTAEEAKRAAVRAQLEGGDTYTCVNVCLNSTTESVASVTVKDFLEEDFPLSKAYAIFSDGINIVPDYTHIFAKARYVVYQYHEDAYLAAKVEAVHFIEECSHINPDNDGRFTMLNRDDVMKRFGATWWGPITDESIPAGYDSLTEEEKQLASQIIKHRSFAFTRE